MPLNLHALSLPDDTFAHQIEATSPGGMLAATCTDTAVLCGSHGSACWPRYGAVALGGTKIAQWVEWEAQSECKNVTCCDGIDCTQSPGSNPHPYVPITHDACPGNGGLYNGLIAPLVNTTVKGWLWVSASTSASAAA